MAVNTNKRKLWEDIVLPDIMRPMKTPTAKEQNQPMVKKIYVNDENKYYIKCMYQKRLDNEVSNAIP